MLNVTPLLTRGLPQFMNNQITDFIKHHYRHFNSAELIEVAEGYKKHLDTGGKMLKTLVVP